MSYRFSMDENDFQTLVKGGIVKKEVRKSIWSKKTETVEFILSDIGFDRMLICIDQAISNMRRNQEI